MRRRGVRLAMAACFAAAVLAAGWEYVRVERALEIERAAAAAFEQDARALASAAVNVRSAQQGYVALGQGIDYWTSRVTAIAEALRAGLADLKSRAAAPEAVGRIDAALATLEEFSRMDGRVREYARSGDQLLASDLIFAEGFQMTEALAADIHGALDLETSARAQRIAGARTRQHAIAGGMASLALLVIGVLALARTPEPRVRKLVEDSLASRPLVPEPPLASPDPVLTSLEEPPAAPPVDLSRAADLCRDLARVSSTQQIPGLLDRAAQILDAVGIVLWIADPDARELIPTTTHGYSAAAVARLTSIPRDADNATAAAFREGIVHTVKADGLTNGAIVAPLVAADGCVGVMAAEVRAGREQQEAVRAVAAIVAAQLATLIGGAPASRAADRKEAANA